MESNLRFAKSSSSFLTNPLMPPVLIESNRRFATSLSSFLTNPDSIGGHGGMSGFIKRNDEEDGEMDSKRGFDRIGAGGLRGFAKRKFDSIHRHKKPDPPP
jgi:hypothetical protein